MSDKPSNQPIAIEFTVVVCGLCFVIGKEWRCLEVEVEVEVEI